MKTNSGEAIVLGLICGLILGGVMLYVQSGNYAQEKANALGREVHQSEYISDEPGKSALIVFAPALAGAGVGWALQEMSDDGKSGGSRDNSVRVDVYEGNVNVNIRGDGGDSTRTDTRTNSGEGWRVE